MVGQGWSRIKHQIIKSVVEKRLENTIFSSKEFIINRSSQPQMEVYMRYKQCKINTCFLELYLRMIRVLDCFVPKHSNASDNCGEMYSQPGGNVNLFLGWCHSGPSSLRNVSGYCNDSYGSYIAR